MIVAALFVALACASAATYKVTGEATYAYEEYPNEAILGSGMCGMELPDDLLAGQKDGVEERELIKASEEACDILSYKEEELYSYEQDILKTQPSAMEKEYVLEEILAQQPMEQPMMQQELLMMQDAFASQQSIVNALEEEAVLSTEEDMLKTQPSTMEYILDEILAPSMMQQEELLKMQQDGAVFMTKQAILKQSFLDEKALEEQFEELQ